MMRIIKIAGLVIVIYGIPGGLYAQQPDSAKTEDKTDIKVLEERVKNIADKIDDNKIELKEDIDDIFQELNVRMLIYVSFVITIIGLIGFIVKFFGRKAIIGWIKDRIKEDVHAITDRELEDTWRESFQKFIEQKVIESEQILEKALKERLGKFEKDREDYIQLKNEILEMKDTIARKEPLSVKSFEVLKEFQEKLESIKKEDEYTADDWFLRAYSEAEEGNHEKAIDYYDKTIKLDPDYVNAYNNRGVSYDELEKYDRAIENFNKAIELKPEKADYYSNRGVSYRKLGKYERAIEDYDKAIELNPEEAVFYNNRGFSFLKLEKYERANEDYDKAIQLDPKDTLVYANLTELKIILNEFEEALNILDKAIELPSELDDKAVLFYLKCITLHLLNEQTSVVEKELDEILLKDFVLTWSTDEIEKWFAKADLLEDTKKFIKEKTELLKKKMK
ncbi:MAG: tetratricopeptide repeat protein [Candidatus Hodarchaeales archaeon]|jgi:tetratricopeptide (TPR) repeat protein